MRSATLFVIVLLAVAALSTALPGNDLHKYITKRSMKLTRALSAECEHAAAPCVTAFYSTEFDSSDPELLDKICTAARRMHTCLTVATADCADTATTQALQELNNELTQNCPQS